MKIRSIVLSALLVAGSGLFLIEQPANASPDRPAATEHAVSANAAEHATAPATTDTVTQDICAVLKANFDPQGTAYYVYRTSTNTNVFDSDGNQYLLGKCLFVPKTSPNFGSLCQQFIFRIWPTTGPLQVSQLVPRWISPGNEHFYCP